MSYSFSMISTFLRCPALFKLLYVDKMVPQEPESAALHFGTAIHAGLNALLEGSESESVFKLYWDDVSPKILEKGRYSTEVLGQMGMTFLDRFKRLHLPHYKFVKGEERLYSALPSGTRVEGTMDALVMYKDKLTLMDFKTSSTRYPEGKPHISMQLALYTYLVEKCLGVVVEQIGYTVFVKAKDPTIQVQVVPLDRTWLDHMIANIDHICADMQSRSVFPRNYETALQYGRKCPACFPNEYSLTPRINQDSIMDGGRK